MQNEKQQAGTLNPNLRKGVRVIDWVDSNIIETQTYDIAKPTLIRTIGFVVADEIDYITVARDLIDDEFRGQISIPKECIRSNRLKE